MTRRAATSARIAPACSIPIDLIDPRSAVSGAHDIEIRDSTHLFLKQSQFADQLRAWIDSHKNDWPLLVTSIAYKWLDEGLQDRGITRDLEWGFPVPDDIADGKLKGKVFYVWFDAPIEYIAATKEWADKNGKGDAWRDWWFGDKAQGRHLLGVHGQGQCAVPHRRLSRSRSWARASPGSWSTGSRASTGSIMTAANSPPRGKRGIFMDTALEIAARRLLALLPDRQCAGKLGLQFHLGAFRRRHQQGSGRCAGQFRQPGDEILRRALRRQGAGRGRIWRRGTAR